MRVGYIDGHRGIVEAHREVRGLQFSRCMWVMVPYRRPQPSAGSLAAGFHVGNGGSRELPTKRRGELCLSEPAPASPGSKCIAEFVHVATLVRRSGLMPHVSEPGEGWR